MPVQCRILYAFVEPAEPHTLPMTHAIRSLGRITVISDTFCSFRSLLLQGMRNYVNCSRVAYVAYLYLAGSTDLLSAGVGSMRGQGHASYG
jgi:hypothetical protein